MEGMVNESSTTTQDIGSDVNINSAFDTVESIETLDGGDGNVGDIDTDIVDVTEDIVDQNTDVEPTIDYESFGFADVEKVKETVTKILGEEPSKEQAEKLLQFFKEEMETETANKQSALETKKQEITSDYGVSKKEFSDLKTWIDKQPDDIKKIAADLTSFDLPTEQIRSGIKLLNMLKTGGAKKLGTSTGSVTKSLTKEAVKSEYEKAVMSRDKQKVDNLRSRAMNELSGDDREWAKAFLS